MDASVFTFVLCAVSVTEIGKKQTAPGFSCLELPDCEDACTRPSRAQIDFYETLHVFYVPIVSSHDIKNVSNSLILKFPLINQMFRHNSTKKNVTWGIGRLKRIAKVLLRKRRKRNRLIYEKHLK